ncbi:MAG: DUF3006 domain-containing protein [Synergistaceae bacterium]|jgi:hypothetical protein|nr:DUF3006 domain-containing protein [Synergistaceae bacterium]
MTVSCFVDRITEGIATVLLMDGENEFTALLPAWALRGAREGDWLRLSFEPDPGKKEENIAAIDSLMRELDG